MTTQVQKQRTTTKSSSKTEEAPEPAKRSPEAQAKLDTSKDFLDEIDEALQGLEEDFATTYTQKGGE